MLSRGKQKIIVQSSKSETRWVGLKLNYVGVNYAEMGVDKEERFARINCSSGQ
jgi:hypothetical protein